MLNVFDADAGYCDCLQQPASTSSSQNCRHGMELGIPYAVSEDALECVAANATRLNRLKPQQADLQVLRVGRVWDILVALPRGVVHRLALDVAMVMLRGGRI